MNLITLLLRSSWKVLTLAAFIGLLSGASTGILIFLINIQVNHSSPREMLIWYFISLCCLRFLTNIISKFLLINLTEKAILELRLILSERILAAPLYHLEGLGSHRILATITDDILSISNTVFVIPTLFIESVVVISCLSYLIIISPTVFLIVAFFLCFGVITYQKIASRAMLFITLARQEKDILFKHFRSLTEGIKELKIHQQRRQKFIFEDLKNTAQLYRRKNVIGMTIFAAAASWGNILFFVVVGLVIFILPTLQVIPTYVLSGYAITILYLLAPLDYIMSTLPVFSKATAALGKIDTFKLSLSNYYDENSLISKVESDNCCQDLEFLGVTHTYHKEQEDIAFTLGPIDLAISGGKIIFIIGGNGSGKSTLVKLITGLYTPESGKIFINGKLITADNQEWYRQHFSVVFSDFYLFDNLWNLGNNISDEKIYNYLVKLQLEKKVKVKNGVLSTTLLSQGQRKRLALLTAYLEDRPIYVFDEWASDQDPVFKKVFYTQILPELKSKGKSVIVVTHDDQYFHLSDSIVKLNYGKLENCIIKNISP